MNPSVDLLFVVVFALALVLVVAARRLVEPNRMTNLTLAVRMVGVAIMLLTIALHFWV